MQIPIIESPGQNQFILTFSLGGMPITIFQSYDTPVVVRKDGKVFLLEKWDCSVTTARHVGQFLRESAATIRKKIADGTYTFHKGSLLP